MSKPQTQEIQAGRLTDNIGQGKTPDERLDCINALEKEMLKHPQVDLDVTQYFCKGLYVRELLIPANVTLVGKIHKDPCINILLQGEIEIATDEGPKCLSAPMIFPSKKGLKRAGYTLSDTRWVTVHPNPDNEQRDADGMADLYTVNSVDQLDHDSDKLPDTG